MMLTSDRIDPEFMPIYDYSCRQCREQFEFLVINNTLPECPVCHSQDLERLLSGFAVSSSEIRKANVRAARRQRLASSNFKDQRVAEAEEIRDHGQGGS